MNVYSVEAGPVSLYTSPSTYPGVFPIRHSASIQYPSLGEIRNGAKECMIIFPRANAS